MEWEEVPDDGGNASLDVAGARRVCDPLHAEGVMNDICGE
jgi:hypothetical protein